MRLRLVAGLLAAGAMCTGAASFVAAAGSTSVPAAPRASASAVVPAAGATSVPPSMPGVGSAVGSTAQPPVASAAESVAPRRGAPSAAQPAMPDVLTFVGVAGLRWSDLAHDPPEALAKAVAGSSRAAMAVRTTETFSCPADGWLTLNAGVRVTAKRQDGRCVPVPTPDTAGAETVVPGWAELTDLKPGRPFDPTWGTLAGLDDGRGQSRGACAYGPGAALALAGPDGTVLERYGPEYLERSPAECPRLFLDAGVLPEGPPRRAALEALDRTVAAVVRARPDAALVLAGIADGAPTPNLAALLVRPPAPGTGEFALYSPSTRQHGLVQLVDLTASLLEQPRSRDLPGATLTISNERLGVADLVAMETSAAVLRDGFVLFFTAFIAGHALALVAIAVALRRGALGRPRAATAILGVGLAFGAVPVAGYLVNLLPWAYWSHPAAARWSTVAAVATLVAAVALAGPWRRLPYGSPALVAALTVTTMAVDVGLLGSRLQLGAPFGLSTLVAGRFYGFGNIPFAVFAMSALVCATAAWAVWRGRRGTLAAVGVAGLAIVVDGAPGLGTDFGGVLALAPGLALLILLLTGVRLTVVRLGLVAVGTVAVVAALAVADWSRPTADRSHLGRFVQQVLDGEALEVVGGKAGASFALFANPLIAIAAVPLTVAAVLAVVRPQTLGLAGLARAQREDPALRALLVAALTTAMLGFAVNDSGVIVPAVALFAGGPLFVAAWAQRWAAEPRAASD